MNDPLGAVDLKLRSPNEPLTLEGEPIGITLGGFWAWNGSDLLNNALRGKLAEYLVVCAIGSVGTVRSEWDPFDVESPSGAKIEVKSAAYLHTCILAYLQSWQQQRLSTISFDIARKHAWNRSTNAFGAEKVRSADVYVFCLLHHRQQDTVNPLCLDQWTFYVAGTHVLDGRFGSQKTVSLNSLKRAGIANCGYEQLSQTIELSYAEKSA